jgi:glycerol kinase
VSEQLIVAIDQGTSSTRAVAFDLQLRPMAHAARRLTVQHPKPGWVEQDPLEILESVIETSGAVIEAIGGPERVAAIGLDNQGETVVAWDGRSGSPLAPAVVWQCRRSEAIVAELAAHGDESWVRELTGLPLDPYFSAGKLTWLLRNVPAVRAAAEAGSLRLGTVDAWLSQHLAGEPLTDPSTASRTQLFELEALRWGDRLLQLFAVPREALPRVVPTAGELGEWRHPAWPDHPLPLRAMVCDQQAALAGHGCFVPGTAKATYGTGVFVLANAGTTPPPSGALLATVAWQLSGDEATSYALVGGVFAAGTLLEWLERLGLFSPAATEQLASSVADSGGVRLLPALAGLGAPWWRPEARGVIAGLTAAAGPAQLAHAALDGIAQRVADVVDALDAAGAGPSELRVDGGLAANGHLLQRQADLLGRPIVVGSEEEATVLGTAGLAGIGAGLLDRSVIASANPPRRVIPPRLAPAARAAEREGWHEFVIAALQLGAAKGGVPD